MNLQLVKIVVLSLMSHI